MKLPADLRVSVIDADPTLYENLVPFFAAAGAGLRRFEGAEQYLCTRRDPGQQCLVVAAELPGMSGVELIDLLRAQGHGDSAVLVVGRDDVVSAVHAMRLGALDVLSRPVNITQLLSALAGVAHDIPSHAR